MNTHNIAGYKFIPLTDLGALRESFLEVCLNLELKGTILLSEEGINIALAGVHDRIKQFKTFLANYPLFSDMTYRESFSDYQPFKFMKVKIKKEIITMRQADVKPEYQQAPHISPQEFKHWLDENRDITLVDTRNDYEVRFGTFRDAINLDLGDFGDFPKVIEKISDEKPIVMFCTGGIRCEKAALHLLNLGYNNVFQLQGGILNYFKETNGEYFEGECFVFDQRVAVGADLKPAGITQCVGCQGPIPKDAVCPSC